MQAAANFDNIIAPETGAQPIVRAHPLPPSSTNSQPASPTQRPLLGIDRTQPSALAAIGASGSHHSNPTTSTATLRPAATATTSQPPSAPALQRPPATETTQVPTTGTATVGASLQGGPASCIQQPRSSSKQKGKSRQSTVAGAELLQDTLFADEQVQARIRNVGLLAGVAKNAFCATWKQNKRMEATVWDIVARHSTMQMGDKRTRQCYDEYNAKLNAEIESGIRHSNPLLPMKFGVMQQAIEEFEARKLQPLAEGRLNETCDTLLHDLGRSLAAVGRTAAQNLSVPNERIGSTHAAPSLVQSLPTQEPLAQSGLCRTGQALPASAPVPLHASQTDALPPALQAAALLPSTEQADDAPKRLGTSGMLTAADLVGDLPLDWGELQASGGDLECGGLSGGLWGDDFDGDLGAAEAIGADLDQPPLSGTLPGTCGVESGGRHAVGGSSRHAQLLYRGVEQPPMPIVPLTITGQERKQAKLDHCQWVRQRLDSVQQRRSRAEEYRAQHGLPQDAKPGKGTCSICRLPFSTSVVGSCMDGKGKPRTLNHFQLGNRLTFCPLADGEWLFPPEGLEIGKHNSDAERQRVKRYREEQSAASTKQPKSMARASLQAQHRRLPAKQPQLAAGSSQPAENCLSPLGLSNQWQNTLVQQQMQLQKQQIQQQALLQHMQEDNQRLSNQVVGMRQDFAAGLQSLGQQHREGMVRAEALQLNQQRVQNRQQQVLDSVQLLPTQTARSVGAVLDQRVQTPAQTQLPDDEENEEGMDGKDKWWKFVDG